MIGAVFGRFQPFHKHHLRYIQSALRMTDFLYIGISNPDPSSNKQVISNPHRSLDSANPCMYFERLHMIQNSLKSEGVKDEKYSIVPFPVNRIDLIKHYMPLDVTYLLVIYDEWGEEKKEILENANCLVQVIARKTLQTKGISATTIREKIAAHDRWEHLVTKSTELVIKQYNIDSRIEAML